MSQNNPLVSATADEVLAGVNLYRKRMVVTACHTDIGFETMKSLAANGAHVIGLARTIEEAQTACAAAGPSCTPINCDLTDLSSIEGAVSLIRGDSAPLDAVVANSESNTQPATPAIFEYIGAFALVNRLCGLLRTNGGRIVMAAIAGANVRDASQKRKVIGFDPLRFGRALDPSGLYAQSTLAIRLYAKEFARRLAVRGVVANAVAAGMAHSLLDLSRATWGRQRWYSLRRLFTRSAAQRAATVVLLAACPQVTGVSGEYWIDGKVAESSSHAEDETLARRVWESSEKVISGRCRIEHADLA